MAEGATKRREAVEASLASVGGKLECMYFAFGEVDVYGIGEFPDEASATAWSLMINSSGAVRLHLVPLMTVEQVDAAARKTPSYRPPGA